MIVIETLLEFVLNNSYIWPMGRKLKRLTRKLIEREELTPLELDFIAAYIRLRRERGTSRGIAVKALLSASPFIQNPETGKLEERDPHEARLFAAKIIDKLKVNGFWSWLFEESGLGFSQISAIFREALTFRDEVPVVITNSDGTKRVETVKVLNSRAMNTRLRSAIEIAKMQRYYPDLRTLLSTHEKIDGDGKSLADEAQSVDYEEIHE